MTHAAWSPAADDANPLVRGVVACCRAQRWLGGALGASLEGRR